MTYSARLPGALHAAGLTHGQRELARWAALPRTRKLRIIAYLCLRLLRLATRRAWSLVCRIGWEASVYARTAHDELRALWRRARRIDARRLRDGLLCRAHELPRTFVQLRVRLAEWRTAPPRLVLVGLAYAALILLPTMLAARAEHHQHRSIRELAIEAQRFAPPPCSLTDGQVWVLDNGRFYRPGRPGYEQRRRDLCGF